MLPDRIEVYARARDGRLFVKEFDRGKDAGLLPRAETDFLRDPSQWQLVESATVLEPHLDEVWHEGSRLFVGGEHALTPDALEQIEPALVISLNEITRDTRAIITSALAGTAGRHVEAPVRDVLPSAQGEGDRVNARVAMGAARRAMERNETIVVHCLMGIHRSPSLSVAALVAHGHFAETRAAFDVVHRVRPVASWVPETVEWFLRASREGEQDEQP